jgi:outer membrane protein assembly factor BamB
MARWIVLVISVPLAVVCATSLIAWSMLGPGFELTERRPDKKLGSRNIDYVLPEPVLTTGPGIPSDWPGSWSCFRSDALNALVQDGPKLARSWPESGPPVLWTIDLGEGYAGAAVRNGRAYIMDYDQVARMDALRCVSLDDGQEIWRHAYPVDIKRNHGMSRPMPAVTDEYCVAIGPKCHVSCVNAITGEQQWPALIDMVERYGAEWPEWYGGQCPLIYDGDVILAPSGPDALLVAINLETGEERWERPTPNPSLWKQTHTSVTPMTLADGRETFVYAASRGVVGVDAKTGEILWTTNEWLVKIATCPSPVVLPDDRLFFCGGYNSGALIVSVVPQPGAAEPYRAEVVRRLTPEEFGSTQHTPVLYENRLYGFRQQDRQFACLDINGDVLWSSGRTVRFGDADGPYIIADGLIFLLDGKRATLTMAEATPDGYRPLGSCQPLAGHDAWGPMTLVEGRLILRDLTRMTCLDITASNE